MKSYLPARRRPKTKSIGTMRESSLHAALKTWYRQPGDRLEAEVDGYLIDILRGKLLVEIQTGNFSGMKSKLCTLLEAHEVRLLLPIAKQKWILRVEPDGSQVSRRKSPKRGRVTDLFSDLVYIPDLAAHPNFSLEVLLIDEEAIWRNDGKGSWRRKGWSVADRKLLQVVERFEFNALEDYLGLIPSALERPFSNKHLKEALGLSTRLAQKMTYCLRKMGALEVTGKRGRAQLFAESL